MLCLPKRRKDFFIRVPFFSAVVDRDVAAFEHGGDGLLGDADAAAALRCDAGVAVGHVGGCVADGVDARSRSRAHGIVLLARCLERNGNVVDEPGMPPDSLLLEWFLLNVYSVAAIPFES